MRRILKGWGRFLLFPIISVAFTGCLTPQVTVKPGAKLESYRKVYIAQPDEDPRGVYPRVVTRLKQTGFQVVEISPGESQSVDSQGTGSIITPQGHVLTCAHVVGSQTNATVWVDRTRYLCDVIASDTNLDLAVLRIQGHHEKFTPLNFASNTNHVMGQDVYTMGFPLTELLGTAPRLNKGLISSTVGMADDPKQLQISAQVQPGNSGGPLLNERGEIVGIILATLNPMRVLVQSGGNLPQNVNFAVKSGPVLSFLEQVNVPLSSATNAVSAAAFETAKKSLALVRSGNVSEEDLKQPALICLCSYVSLWDMFFRFRAIQIDFLDVKTTDRLFRVGQYRDDPFSSEDNTLNRLFGDISSSFFPNQLNPFRNKPTQVQSHK